MVPAFCADLECLLITSGKLAKKLGHPVHKGSAREFFIKVFLEDQIYGDITIGTGEIFDCDSEAEEERNQFDLILHKKDAPKLCIGNINTFLVESVISAIEVKSQFSKRG